MRRITKLSWIPAGVTVVLLLSFAVAWSFRDRLGRTVECAALYAEASSAPDTARVDSVVVVPAGVGEAITCGELRRDPAVADRR